MSSEGVLGASIASTARTRACGCRDIDPPLHHIKAAHDKCVAWLDDHTQQAEPVAESYRRATDADNGQSMTQAGSGNPSF